MIISVILRHFKIYKGLNYIPLSDGTNFTSILGENGAGKSSILESLDCYFNKKPFADWSINLEAKAEGSTGENSPHIVPIFLIKKDRLKNTYKNDQEQFKKALILSDYLWTTNDNKNIDTIKEFYKQREILKTKFETSEYLLILVGRKHKSTDPFFGSYQNTLSFINEKTHIKYDEKELNDFFSGFYDYIIGHYSYLYIPVETDVQTYTKLETQDMQKLMDKNIQLEIENAITEKTVKTINGHLDKFVEEIEGVLESYKYKGKKKDSLTMPDLVSKIIESYFSIKILNKKIPNSSKSIAVNELSSGEKRKALIDLAYSFLIKNNDRSLNLILAIDEPEASLHINSCFEQFEKLIKIANENHQILITTHWYGFLPIVNRGTATSINKGIDNKISSDFFSLSNFREYIKQEKSKRQKEKLQGPLPLDYRIKSYNDLVQSIVVSLIQEKPYNWIICEGSSEKIYFEFFFKNEIKDKKLRILPVGGYEEVIKIYNYLLGPFKDSDYEKKGKIICLIDTDAQRVDVKPDNNYKNLLFKRLVFNKTENKILYNVDSDQTTETTIEDSLDSKTFLKTLDYFKDEHLELKELIIDKNINVDSKYSKNALDLRDSQKETLKSFFNKDKGDYKIIFAKKYLEFQIQDDIKIEWVEEIKKILNN